MYPKKRQVLVLLVAVCCIVSMLQIAIGIPTFDSQANRRVAGTIGPLAQSSIVLIYLTDCSLTFYLEYALIRTNPLMFSKGTNLLLVTCSGQNLTRKR